MWRIWMRSSLNKFMAVGFGLGLLAAPLTAQDRGRGGVVVPDGYEPPRGMCRIWIEGVPAGQQPAPTDCATAIKKRPANAVVVFGEPLKSLEEAERLRDRLPGRELWNDRRGLVPSRSSGEARSREGTESGRRAEQAPRTRTEPAPRLPETQLPRSRTEPAKAPPPAARQVPPPPSGEERGRVRPPPPTPPPGYTQDLLARERWLDEELLASLYGESPPGRGYGEWMDDGRVAPPGAVGDRGLGRTGVDGLVPWARSADGRYLTAREVEVRVRGEVALLGGQYGYAGGYGGSYGTPGFDPAVLVPRPGECSDRNFDGRCDDLMGGPDGCADRNGDGRCDDARYDPAMDYCAPGVRCDPYTIRRARETAAGVGSGYGSTARPDQRLDGAAGYSGAFCFDRDRDGRCDEPWMSADRIPQTLPEMASAVALRRGVPSYDVERWLQRSDAQARITDRDGDGIPERVTWIDPSGRIVQIWTDRNGDGIADRVELFRDGLPVQVISR